MSEAKYQLTKKSVVCLNEPTIGSVENLQFMGFDINDLNKLNQSWIECITDNEKLRALIINIFDTSEYNGEFTSIKEVNLKTVYTGLLDFFGECGVILR